MLTALIKNNERAFTLIELLIVIAILGVLAAIAIPQFSSYRTRSYNSSARADLRNAITVQEDYYIEQDVYCMTIADLIGATYGLYTSQGVTISVVGVTTGYTMKSYHSAGDITWSVAGPGGSITS
jgi:type IV pilus assembly protein PilA